MILERLKGFWEEQPDTMRPGYQKALLTKWVRLDAEGNFIGVTPLTGDGSKQREGRRIEVPREQPQRTSGVRPRLVHDNGRYVLGLMEEGDKPDRVAQAHRAYRALLESAYEETKSPAFDAVSKWLARDGVAEAAAAAGITATDELWITVDGVDPTESETAAAFWNRPAGGDAIVMRCLVTGDMAEVGKAMPYPIKRIPGGQMSGNMLVSVNFNAAQSYGLEGNLNSPISKTAAEAICNALNRLLASDLHSYRVGDTVYVYWVRGQAERDALRELKEPDPVQVDDLMALYQSDWELEEPSSKDVERVLHSPKSGMQADPVKPKDVTVIGLTANASRIAVRDYHELTMDKLNLRVGQWFTRLALYGANGRRLRDPKLNVLAYSAYRDKKDVPKHVPVSLVKAALEGAPLPTSLLATAVRRNVAEQGPYTTYKGVRKMSYARLALIKACIDDPEKPQLSALNPSHPDPAYHCGRLLAVIDNIQRVYFKVEGREINRTVVDRHYGGTSTAPGISFGPLLADATQAHLGKLQRNVQTRKTYAALERELREVLESLPGEFPQTLDHFEQGLFALGFYHQRTASIARALNRIAKGEGDAGADAIIDEDTPSEEDENE